MPTFFLLEEDKKILKAYKKALGLTAEVLAFAGPKFTRHLENGTSVVVEVLTKTQMPIIYQIDENGALLGEIRELPAGRGISATASPIPLPDSLVNRSNGTLKIKPQSATKEFSLKFKLAPIEILYWINAEGKLIGNIAEFQTKPDDMPIQRPELKANEKEVIHSGKGEVALYEEIDKDGEATPKSPNDALEINNTKNPTQPQFRTWPLGLRAPSKDGTANATHEGSLEFSM